MEFKELADKLEVRFKDVPNVEREDIENWIEFSLMEHGFDKDEDVPTDQVTLVLLYAEADGALQISLRTSHFFQFKDAEESVDKSMVTDKYRTMADVLSKRYEKKKAETVTARQSTFHIITRADRP